MAASSTSYYVLKIFMEEISTLYGAFPALADGDLSGHEDWGAYKADNVRFLSRNCPPRMTSDGKHFARSSISQPAHPSRYY